MTTTSFFILRVRGEVKKFYDIDMSEVLLVWVFSIDRLDGLLPNLPICKIVKLGHNIIKSVSALILHKSEKLQRLTQADTCGLTSIQVSVVGR
jgi:hypothetical protein